MLYSPVCIIGESGETMDQLLAMRTFARVVEAGTFTKAADSLNMPKASVTKLVQSLESAPRRQAPAAHHAPRIGHAGRRDPTTRRPRAC
jgi:cephalosporin hydroxylase